MHPDKVQPLADGRSAATGLWRATMKVESSSPWIVSTPSSQAVKTPESERLRARLAAKKAARAVARLTRH